ncbi:MAG: hypothetical protein J1E56_01350 [Ruminococcus sp.]|nr:hypothetical protein [Ruminococcus sp.]
MKKIAIIMLCFCLLPFCSLTVFAENSTESDFSNSAVISVIVPESHNLEVSAPDGISVYLDGEENDKFDIPRLSEPTFEIRSKNGEIISKVILNGDDITDKLVNGQYKLPPVYENLFLTVETKAADSSDNRDNNENGSVCSDKITTDNTSSDNEAITSDSPKTGDNRYISVYVLIMCTSLIFILGFYRKNKHKRLILISDRKGDWHKNIILANLYKTAKSKANGKLHNSS